MIKQTEKRGAATVAEFEELRRTNLHFEKLLERQGAELAEARIETDKLARSISHDLRSPLHIIAGFAEMMAKHSGDSLDDKGRHCLERITTATTQIGQLLDSILALSEMGRSKMNRVPLDFEGLARKVVRNLEAEKGDRRVIWIIGNLATVTGDPELLQKVLTSLASNALKFTRSREVARIQIGIEGEGEGLRYFVRDNGTSFDIKHRETMFGALLGEHPPADSKGGAIRLALIKRIIKRHGGRMWIEATADGGATFFFSLPDADESFSSRESL
jgi:light-regulated signal transduction histidine kinase (bacteriophytochrome)